MAQPACRACLRLETLPGSAILDQPTQQELECHTRLRSDVLCLVDLAHPSTAKKPDDPIGSVDHEAGGKLGRIRPRDRPDRCGQALEQRLEIAFAVGHGSRPSLSWAG